MKIKILLSVLLLGCTLPTFSENEPNLPKRQSSRAFSYGNWVGKMGQTEAFAAAVDLSPEQRKTLQKVLGEIQAKHAECSGQVRRIAEEQAELCRVMLETPHGESKEVFEKIDLIAKYRTEQAKLAIRSLIVLRDTLKADQYPKAREFFKKEIAKRRAKGARKGSPALPQK